VIHGSAAQAQLEDLAVLTAGRCFQKSPVDIYGAAKKSRPAGRLPVKN
jgi:hypothetical protein